MLAVYEISQVPYCVTKETLSRKRPESFVLKRAGTMATVLATCHRRCLRLQDMRTKSSHIYHKACSHDSAACLNSTSVLERFTLDGPADLIALQGPDSYVKSCQFMSRARKRVRTAFLRTTTRKLGTSGLSRRHPGEGATTQCSKTPWCRTVARLNRLFLDSQLNDVSHVQG